MNINIRPVRPDDAQRIWEIRNEPAALAVTATPEAIPLIRHIDWFERKYFSGQGNVCFVAEIDQKVVGYCRFDLDSNNSRYINSIAIASSMHGQGIGTLLLQQSIEQLESSMPIHAEVRKFNIASIKMFERADFEKISEDDRNIYYRLLKN